VPCGAVQVSLYLNDHMPEMEQFVKTRDWGLIASNLAIGTLNYCEAVVVAGTLPATGVVGGVKFLENIGGAGLNFRAAFEEIIGDHGQAKEMEKLADQVNNPEGHLAGWAVEKANEAMGASHEEAARAGEVTAAGVGLLKADFHPGAAVHLEVHGAKEVIEIGAHIKPVGEVFDKGAGMVEPLLDKDVEPPSTGRHEP
jgi:hypothetical protein